jgi:hypothetical protein
MTSEGKPYEQFLLFGDSITEQSGAQGSGFAFAPALQDGTLPAFHNRNNPIRPLDRERQFPLSAIT